MQLIDLFIRCSFFFPPLPIESSSLKLLKLISPDADPKRYMTFSLVLALILVSLIFLFVPADSLFTTFGIFLISVACIFFFCIQLPPFTFAGTTSKMESELPLFLRTMSVLLELRISFSKALWIASDGQGAFSRQMILILKEIDKGASLQKMFGGFASTTSSSTIKRALIQIQHAYQSGQGAHELRQLADEFLSIQRFKLREHGSKSALFGLLFIAVSTILPTFFTITTSLSGTVVEGTVSPELVPVVFLIGFPLLSLLIVLVARSLLPRMVFTRETGFNVLPLAALFVLSVSIVFLPFPVNMAVSLAAGAALLFFFFKEYTREKQIDEIEKYLPDCLMLAASLPSGAKLEIVFESWQQGSYGSLSKESSICLKQLRSHIRPEKVLHDLQYRHPSMILRRACQFIEVALQTNTVNRLTEVAEDILVLREIDRERQNMLSLQRYTLLFSTILMPLIIKSSLSLIEGMTVLTGAEKIVGVTVFNTLMPIYLIIYGVLISYFIAELESRRYAATMYFLLSVALSFLTFYFISI